MNSNWPPSEDTDNDTEFATFSELVKKVDLNGGDTVNVELAYAGPDYKEQFIILDDGSKSWADDGGDFVNGPLIIQGVDSGHGPPTINGGWIDNDKNGVDDDGDFVQISGLMNGSFFATVPVGLVRIEDTQNVVFRGFNIINSQEAGISVQNENEGVFTKNVTIEDCRVFNVRTHGIIAIGTNSNEASPPILQAENITVRNNKIQRACMAINELGAVKAGGESLTMANVKNFWVYNNEIWDNQKEGLDIQNGSQDGDVYRNLVRDRDVESKYPRSTGSGIYIDGSHNGVTNVTVRENVVHNQSSGMIVSSESGGDVNEITFTNNLVYDCWTTSFAITGNGGESSPPGEQSYVKVYHNTFVGPPTVVPAPEYPVPPFTINQQVIALIGLANGNTPQKLTGFEFRHNIVARNSPTTNMALFTKTVGAIPATDVSYNLFYNYGVTEVTFGPYHGDNPIFGDPKFVSETVLVGNKWYTVPYSIGPNSAALQYGEDVLTYTDLDASYRPVPSGTYSDLGAFENPN